MRMARVLPGLALLVLLSAAVAVAVVFFQRQYAREAGLLATHSLIALDVAYRSTIRMHRLDVETRFKTQILRPEVLDLLAAAREAPEEQLPLWRGRLYRLLRSDYQDMAAAGLRLLQFHLPDGRSLVRFHSPTHTGDPSLFAIRPSVRIANRELRPVTGFEGGRVAPAFRNVFPIVAGERHLGSVELSLRFDEIHRNLLALLPVGEYGLIIHRSASVELLFPDQAWNFVPSALHPDYVMEHPTISKVSRDFEQSDQVRRIDARLRSDGRVLTRLNTGGSFALPLLLDGAGYTLAFQAIHDVEDRQAAYLIGYIPNPVLPQLYHSEIWQAAIVILLLVLLHLALAVLIRQRQRLARGKRRLEVITQTMSDGLCVIDRQGSIGYVNEAACAMTGYDASDMIGQSLHALLHRHAHGGRMPVAECPMFRTYQSGMAFDGELWFMDRVGRLFPVEVSSRILMPHGQADGAVGAVILFRDIGARRQAESQLRKLSLAVEQSPESIVITDLDCRIEYVNEAFVRTTGYRREEVLGQNPSVLKSGKTPPARYEGMWAVLRAGQVWRGEFVNRRRDGSEFTELAIISPVREEDGRISHYLAVKQDVTGLKAAEAEINRLAYFDALTGLPNRALLLDRLGLLMAVARRESRQDALILLNIDRFKNINDARGHEVGDRLLRAVGERLSERLREGDTLARLAADEFAILLQTLDHHRDSASRHALTIAEAIHAELRQPFMLSQGEFTSITVSLGIALCPDGPGDTPREAIRRADTALHRAKEAGGNQTAFFEEGMGELVRQRFRIERELRQALAHDDLRLYLQSQVDTRGLTVGAEALVRWQHPERGLLAPGAFIPIAEESDLIVEIDAWVIRQVCMLMAEQETAGHPLSVAVNVSPRHFNQHDFVDWLRGLIRVTGVDPNHLTLEITEGMMIDNVDAVVARMTALALLGIHFSVDDFGTGYSSLAYLKRLPIHEIKIDKTFIQDAPQDPNDAALVETILAVARNLRLQVVAEGVETVEQAAFLNARAAVIHQGYLYGRPEPAEVWLGRWRALGQSPYP